MNTLGEFVGNYMAELTKARQSDDRIIIHANVSPEYMKLLRSLTREDACGLFIPFVVVDNQTDPIVFVHHETLKEYSNDARR